MSSIKPTIGRKVWLWTNVWTNVWTNGHAAQDPKQAFDATVIFVHSDERVNLRFDNHWGTQGTPSSVLLRDPRESDAHGAVEEALVATWTPYQVSTAKPAA